ncbi:D-alanyl-D-alanine carboxypeptidase/D-alanyl-D-alanine endopeptidase [Candidatus Nitrotoga sp. AM1P]|uniref:D-alanyl-D-alanine carboxypeptidase/D-alanyl-D-alanine endopeptidase n=1 Tax=Candidatus Nitrotoga sp. AM1P TaxID=2559597 RepID=UPI0010BC6451|nr:D-alanyl-D-alanine carboxypeptidase/D-alanyl-D-alanine-endopeptidase [Candidatus Nitrotoga sp. AM1P]BBJ23983.1 D-alanyl-D-alanine carboxypeptidase [Candidatus Nitrotoga sp. AM1P]
MKLLHTLLFIFCILPSTHAATLPPSVVKALQLAHIPLDSIGVEVREVNARTPLISVNAKQSMNPASTMKLLTTYAGLELLGPSYSWKTEAYLDGKLEQDVLHGDLILKGYGDPKLTLEKLWLWLHELRSRGLREIRGDLVLDRSVFQLAPHDPAEFDNEPMRPYNTGPDALLLNFNSVRLRFIPEGEKIKIISMPELAGIRLDNRVTAATVLVNCSDWNDALSMQLQGDTLRVQGVFPAQCGERERHVSLLSHPSYLYAVFRVLWQEMGGVLQGTLRESTVPGSATLFATHHSAPLAELIRDINKFSNNVMARQLFLSLGRTAETSANVTYSELTIRNWLTQKKLYFPELILENGAGLSRRERISPRSLALLLSSAQRSPLSTEFEASLPIVGVDGTFKKRLTDSEAANHAHLKTGSLEGVQAVAGYVQSRSGKQWILVFLINHPNAAAGQQAQNALIEWVQRRY